MKRLFLVLLGLCLGTTLSAREGGPPNILLILADDVGREVIGAYGGESYETPRIDQLAEEGMLFEHFYSATVCHPTRIMLMSGRYPWNLGEPKWGGYPEDEEHQTIAWEMQEAGYATAIAGKWQLVLQKIVPDHPQRLGFQESCLFGWHEGPRFWSPHLWQNGELREDTEGKYGPELYTEFLINFMERNREKPFLAVYSMALAHAVSDDLTPHPAHGPEGRYMTYAEMVADMDVRVGEMVDAVLALGLSENTLILFTSDNGTTGTNFLRHEGDELIREKGIQSMWQGQVVKPGKGKLTDSGTRVPTIAVWPRTIEAGSHTDILADMTDLMPTFMQLANAGRTNYHIDGRTFAGALTGGVHKPRKWICTPHRGEEMAIRSHDWKLRANGNLYDMNDDPEETSPIAKEEDTEETAAARLRLERWRSEVVPTR